MRTTISLNELEMKLYKASEGLGLPMGVCESIAQSITMLESIGFQALHHFIDNCHPSQNWQNSLTLSQSNSNHLVLDFNHSTCLHHLAVCSGMITEHLEDEPEGTVVLDRVDDGILLLPELLKKAVRPVHFETIDARTGRVMVALLNPQYAHPEWSYTVPPQPSATSFIKIATKDDSLGVENIEQQQNHQQHQQTLVHSLSHGLSIETSAWKTLKRIGHQILVKESHISRTNAGESADQIDDEDILISS